MCLFSNIKFYYKSRERASETPRNICEFFGNKEHRIILLAPRSFLCYYNFVYKCANNLAGCKKPRQILEFVSGSAAYKFLMHSCSRRARREKIKSFFRRRVRRKNTSRAESVELSATGGHPRRRAKRIHSKKWLRHFFDMYCEVRTWTAQAAVEVQARPPYTVRARAHRPCSDPVLP